VIGSLVSPRFVGRTEELDHLLRTAEVVGAGTPASCLVTGEAGVGKSRLVAELSHQLEADGWRVLTGQCVELGGDGLPLAPLADVLRTLALTTPPAQLDEFLGAARRELVWLLPTLADEVRDGVGASPAQLLELVLGVVNRVGRGAPLLLVVEDLHWADRSTLELVAFLSRALQGTSVLLLMTYRSDELHRTHPLRPLLNTWERGRSVVRVELARLTRQEVRDQLAGILGQDPPAAVVDAVYERSQGNAYLAEEVLGIIEGGREPDELPPSLRDVLLTHVELLSPDARATVLAASAAGTSVSEALLAEVVDLAPAALAVALREVVEHHLLVVDDTLPGYAFRHALTRDAVYHDLLPGERVQLHSSYGEALAADPSLGGRGVSAMLAHHWYAALDLPRALHAAVAAGREAVTHAPADALEHFERALEVWPRVVEAEELAGNDHVGVLDEAATAAYNAGRTDRGLQLLDRALAELPADAPRTRRATLLISQAVALRDLGREGDAFAVLEGAMPLVPEDEPSEARARVLAALASVAMRLGQFEPCAGYGRRAVEAAQVVGARAPEADATITLGVALSHLDRPDEGLERVRHGLELARQLGDGTIILRAYVNLSDGLESSCRHVEAADAAREGMQLAEEYGAVRIISAYLAGNLAEPLIRLGRWDEASETLTGALQDDRERFFAGTLLELLAQMAVLRGDVAEASQRLQEAQTALAGDTDPQYVLSLALIAGELARLEGDPRRGLRLLEDAFGGDDEPWARYRWPMLWEAARSLAELRTRARDRREERGDDVDAWGLRLSRSLSSLAAQTPHAGAYRRLCEAEQAEDDSALEAWTTAREACRESEDPYLLAYALGRSAEAQVAVSDRAAATVDLRESVRLARALGATLLVTRAEHLARRARLDLDEPASESDGAAEPPSDTPRDADQVEALGLTERELDVLALIADGRPNADIARTLFISPKTVSVHVSNILAKLQVRSRVEAAGVAHRHGIYGPAQ
jgi:DNA-binding CsgD family transcriptional regulator/tetratricopeptide (TPR) repeat protein